MSLQSNADLSLLNELLPVSSLSWPLFPVFSHSFVNICSYTVPPSVFWSSSQLTSQRIVVKYLIYSRLLSILLDCSRCSNWWCSWVIHARKPNRISFSVIYTKSNNCLSLVQCTAQHSKYRHMAAFPYQVLITRVTQDTGCGRNNSHILKVNKNQTKQGTQNILLFVKSTYDAIFFQIFLK